MAVRPYDVSALTEDEWRAVQAAERDADARLRAGERLLWVKLPSDRAAAAFVNSYRRLKWRVLLPEGPGADERGRYLFWLTAEPEIACGDGLVEAT